ncbi:MAG: cation transporting ATPase C-terminal domain-containing protein [Thiocapsa sp. C3-3m]
MALPITASQILWVNMVTAVTLALALAFEPAEEGVMRRPPRPPKEPLITRVMLTRIIFVSLLMIALTFGVYEWELMRGQSLEVARTAAVNMLVFGELVYLFNVRRFTAPTMARHTLYGNPVAFWASLVLIGLQLLFTYAPPMHAVFHTSGLDLAAWGLILGLSVFAFFAVVIEKGILRRLGIKRM